MAQVLLIMESIALQMRRRSTEPMGTEAWRMHEGGGGGLDPQPR
jgi:hypothetical protein